MAKNFTKEAVEKKLTTLGCKISSALDWFRQNVCTECEDHRGCGPECPRQHACLLANILFELRNAPRLIMEA
jgi:hypothetical protein